MKRFYITTPIYYVNANLHLGHAYTTVLADVLGRYHALMGDEVRMLTGTDEHGQKVLEASRRLGTDPRAHVDGHSARFREAWDRLKIRYDRFIRTTDEDHVRRVQEALVQLHANGHLYEKDYVGWYDVKEERYYTEKDLVDGRSPDGNEVAELREKNWFFRMSAFQDWLVEHIESTPGFIQPDSRRNEVLGFLRRPLEDLCISRPKSRMDWGIELPFDRDFVCYVWVDALLNYVTGSGDPGRKEMAGEWWPASTHLIGKDILTTHCVYWITLLKALDIAPPDSLLAHGWWLVDEKKMSKSDGNVIDPMAMIEPLGVDSFRFFLIREMVPWNDANFGLDSIVKRLNTDLANDLGNLLSRVTNLADKNFGGRLPSPGEAELTGLRGGWTSLLEGWQERVRENDLYGLLEELFRLVREANRMMESHAPWKLVKEDPEKAALVLAEMAESLRLSALLLEPVMPDKSREVLERLGCSADGVLDWQAEARQLQHGKPVFPRIDAKDLRKTLENKSGKTPPPAKVEEEGLVDFEHFSALRIVAARIEQADKVEGADRLLKLILDDGSGKRQIVAGIASHYKAEELSGRMICAVVNLKPATIRGVESHGMLLAAKTRKKLTLVSPGEVAPGTPIG